MLVKNLDFAEYLEAPELSSSDIKLILKSPKHFAEKEPKDPTPEMRLGTLVHAFLLEPETIRDKFIVKPSDIDRRTTTGKKAWVEFQLLANGKEIISPEEWELAALIAETFMQDRQPIFGGDVLKESTIFFEHEGYRLKARPDLINLGSRIVFDFKVTSNSDFSSFQRQIANFGYHIQAKHYLNACKKEFGEDFEFVWAVIERDAPFGHRLFTPDESTLRIAEQEIAVALNTHKICVEKNEWRCYDREVNIVSLPNYYLSPALN